MASIYIEIEAFRKVGFLKRAFRASELIPEGFFHGVEASV